MPTPATTSVDPNRPPPSARRRLVFARLLPALAILLAGWFVFSPALHGDWLWDDNSEITTNPELRDPAGLGKIWFAPSGPDYFPLKTTVQWVQWRLWENRSTFGYHLTTLGLHLIAALLLWRLLHRLGLRFAWLGGLLFAVHPVVVESVAWIAELKNTLSLPLLLLAGTAFLDFDARHRRRDYALALGFFLAAALSKSSVVMFPCVLFLHAWWKRSRLAWPDLRRAAPFFAVSLGLGLVTIWFQHLHAVPGRDLSLGGPLPRLAGAGLSLAFYAWKCLWPVGLAPIYPRWEVNPPAPAQFLPWFAIALLAAWLWTKRATWGRHAIFGLGFFALNLLPVIGLIGMSFLQIASVSDHLVYLPLVGLVGLAVAAVGAIEVRLPRSLRGAAVAGATIGCALLAVAARSYAENFSGPESLWTCAVARTPGSATAQNNLGVVRLQQQRWSEAAGNFTTALVLDPDYAEAHINLANAWAKLGRAAEALGHYATAARLDPDSHQAQFNWANLLCEQGRLNDAIGHYQTAVRLAPAAADAQFNLANALVQAHRWSEAAAHYETALRLWPDSPDGQLNFGNLLAAMGRMVDATAHFERAVQLAPASAEAHFCLADARAQTGQMPAAIPEYETTLRLAPTNAAAQTSLGNALLAVGRAAEAADHYRRALSLAPDDAEARANLIVAMKRAGAPSSSAAP